MALQGCNQTRTIAGGSVGTPPRFSCPEQTPIGREKSTSKPEERRSRVYTLREERIKTACQSSKLSPPPEPAKCGRFSPYAHGLTDFDKITIEIMEGGGRRVNWPIDGPDIVPDHFDILDPARPELDDISRLRASNEQSTKSRLRSAWTIGNATCEWVAMTTLTYPVSRRPKNYDETADHRKRFFARVDKSFPNTQRAWILEFTEAKAAHYHIFWSGSLGKEILNGEFETVKRRGFDGGEIQETKILRGELDKRIVGWWRNRAGDGSKEFEAFQNGGITELIRCPDGAARYAAKEAAKRTQKIAPFLVSQWWGMSNSCRPKVEKQITMTVGDYVDQFGPIMYRHLFNS